jgi:hypothetical protein
MPEVGSRVVTKRHNKHRSSNNSPFPSISVNAQVCLRLMCSWACPISESNTKVWKVYLFPSQSGRERRDLLWVHVLRKYPSFDIQLSRWFLALPFNDRRKTNFRNIALATVPRDSVSVHCKTRYIPFNDRRKTNFRNIALATVPRDSVHCKSRYKKQASVKSDSVSLHCCTCYNRPHFHGTSSYATSKTGNSEPHWTSKECTFYSRTPFRTPDDNGSTFRLWCRPLCIAQSGYKVTLFRNWIWTLYLSVFFSLLYLQSA